MEGHRWVAVRPNGTSPPLNLFKTIYGECKLDWAIFSRPIKQFPFRKMNVITSRDELLTASSFVIIASIGGWDWRWHKHLAQSTHQLHTISITSISMYLAFVSFGPNLIDKLADAGISYAMYRPFGSCFNHTKQACRIHRKTTFNAHCMTSFVIQLSMHFSVFTCFVMLFPAPN